MPSRELVEGDIIELSVGIFNSFLMYILIIYILHLDWATFQTIYFLKLTISGHLLIYVAHTKQRWWRFLPSGIVIVATLGTQIIATMIAYLGLFMAPISPLLIVFVWVWAFVWMQVGEGTKVLREVLTKNKSN